MSRDRRELLAHVAHLYYDEDCDQDQIATELGVSRSKVSRMLAEARREQIVEVVVHYPWSRDREMEQALCSRFQLLDVRVLRSDRLDQPQILQGLGFVGAELFGGCLRNGMIVGISRGTSVSSVVRALKPQRELTLQIVQLQGAMGDRLEDGSELAHHLFGLYSGEFRSLHAPLVMESAFARDILMREPSIQAALHLAKKADVALVGIGSTSVETSGLLRTGLVRREDLDALIAEGIVGDIAGIHFDQDGAVSACEINSRMVCADSGTVKAIPIVVGVGGGRTKVPAIRAALQGKWVDMLATDSAVAAALLDGSE